nr:MAG TPA: hypothetical protein [Caudoviricetes sp.]
MPNCAIRRSQVQLGASQCNWVPLRELGIRS